jgi:hypothetical protein
MTWNVGLIQGAGHLSCNVMMSDWIAPWPVLLRFQRAGCSKVCLNFLELGFPCFQLFFFEF